MRLKNRFKVILFGLLVIVLAGCQTVPYKSVVSFDSAKGSGTKSIYAALYVDGSCQIAKSEQFTDHYDASKISKFDVEKGEYPTCKKTAEENAISISKPVGDGYLVDPNNPDSTVQEKIDRVEAYLKTLVPSGYEFSATEYTSANWKDEMMNDPTLNADETEFKVIVYKLTYSFDSFEDYISKTKALIGDDIYSETDLAADDEAGRKWAEWTVTEKTVDDKDVEVVTYKEKESVLYWSVFNIISTFYQNEDYYNSQTTDLSYLATMSDIAIEVNGEETGLLVSESDNDIATNTGYLFLEATLTFEKEAKDSSMLWIALGAAGVVVVGASVVFLSKKKKVNA